MKSESTRTAAASGFPVRPFSAYRTTPPSSDTAPTGSTRCGSGGLGPPRSSTSKCSTTATTAEPSSERPCPRRSARCSTRTTARERAASFDSGSSISSAPARSGCHAPLSDESTLSRTMCSSTSTTPTPPSRCPSCCASSWTKGLSFEAAGGLPRHLRVHEPHLLPEALETWSLPLFESLLPRHLELIISSTAGTRARGLFAPATEVHYTHESIDELGERRVRMAWLSTVASHSVNGVAALHSELVRKNLLSDFAEMCPTASTTRRTVSPRGADAGATRSSPASSPPSGRSGRRISRASRDSPAGRRCRLLPDPPRHQESTLVPARIVREDGVRMDPHALLDTQVKRIHEYAAADELPPCRRLVPPDR